MTNISELLKTKKRLESTIRNRDREIASLREENKKLRENERLSRWERDGETAGGDIKAKAIIVSANEDIKKLEAEKERLLNELLKWVVTAAPIEVLGPALFPDLQDEYGEEICHIGIVAWIRYGQRLGNIKISKVQGIFSGTVEEAESETLKPIQALIARAPFLSEILQRRSGDILSRQDLFNILIELSPLWYSPNITDEAYDLAFNEVLPSDISPDEKKAIGDDARRNLLELTRQTGRGKHHNRKRKPGRKKKSDIELVPPTGIDFDH